MRIGFLYLFQIIILVASSVSAENTKVIVGCDYNYPPYSYHDNSGKTVGYDIDVINALSKMNGWKTEYQLNQWDSVLNKLSNGEIDIITSIIYSESREKIFDFSFPLHTEYYYIFAKQSTRISDVNDLEGKTIAKLEGDVSNDMFLEPLGLLNKHKTVRSLPEAIMLVNTGVCDYVIAPYPLAMDVIEKKGLTNIVAKGNSVFPSVYCFAVKQGNDELLAKINEGIQKLTQSGELDLIYNKWVKYRHQEDKYERFLDYTLIILAGFGLVILILLVFWRSLRKQISKKSQQIKEAERVYKDIFNSAIDSLVIFDNKGYIMDVNKETMRMYGMTYEQMVGAHGANIISPENLNVFETFMKVMNSEGYFHAGDVKKIVNSQLVYLNIRGVKVFFNGKERFLVVLRNVTKEQNALIKLESAKKEAESANKTKSRFLSTISHEIRTPLNAIIGYSDLLSKSNLQNNQAECNKKIKLSGEILLNLVNDILDLTKMEAEKLELRNEPFSISNLVNKICDIEKFKAKEKSLNMVVDINKDIPDVLVGDEVRLSQVLLNLLNNAIKFTDNGSVSLTVDFKLSNTNNNITLFFKVKDTGVGISKDNQNRLFNAFEQVHDSSAKRYGGTGLGLAISKQLINFMNGDIKCKSEEGEGSIFEFNVELKIYEGDDFNHTRIENLNKNDSFDLNGISALLVEDNEFNAEILTSQLRYMKCNVTHASSGQDAVNLSKSHQFNIILMDIEMPGMNGYETAKEIRKLNIETPIIALSAHVLVSEMPKLLDAGISDSLNKPVTADKIGKTILKYANTTSGNSNQSIDTDKGLIFFVNDKTSYHKALNSFYKNYVTIPDKLMVLYSEDIESIKNHTHDLKSGAKIIGADYLCKIATSCDNLLRDKPDSITYENINNLKNELNNVLFSIEKILKHKLQSS